MKSIIKYMLMGAAVALTGCGGISTPAEMESSVQEAEMAVAQGDMTMASSIATKITDGKNLTGLSAEQLARLSIVYMQIADADESAGDESIAKAADLYRQAYITDATRADSFYTNTDDVDKMRHVVKLSTLVTSIDNPKKIDLDNDSLPVDDQAEHQLDGQ